MAVPTFLQNKTYSTNTAATSHQFTFTSAIRERGGAIGPSCLVLTASYDGAAGDQITGITDSLGNTWVKGTSATNGATTHGEMWYAANAAPGACTVTIALASSVKLTAVAVELDQVRPVNPLDQHFARIDTTSSTSRSSAATNSTKRAGMIEVIIAGIGWQHVTLTCSNGGAGYTGTLVTTKDASSGIGVGMARRATETKNITGSNSIGRFTMSASTTTPCAVMTLTFFRDGVVTGTDEDGWIDNIEGVSALYKNDTQHFLYTSSTSAPGGGTGSSEKTRSFHFFSDYSANILSGVTIGDTVTAYFSSGGGYDDGTGYMGCALYAWGDASLGSTLELADENFSGGTRHDLGTAPTIAGEFSVQLAKSTEYNTSGTTNIALTMEGDTQGGASGTQWYCNEYSGNVPAYLVLALDYPALTVPQRCMVGVGL